MPSRCASVPKKAESFVRGVNGGPRDNQPALLVVVIAVFIWNRLPVGAVAILTSLTLFAIGVLTVNEALAGFGDPCWPPIPVVLFIAALFVVAQPI